jgi:amidohydrolase
MLEQLVRDRRALHKIPELKFDLPRTQAYLLAALEKTGAHIETLSPAGILAYFDAGRPETVALRADMDALPIAEAATHAYASTHPGQMHACGHDGHMAMLMGFARYASQRLEEFPRNLLLIFQPAEEGGGGGRMIAGSGALERYNATRIFAMHVAPELPMGTLASRAGAFFSKSSEVYVTIHGRSAHAANAGDGIDALAAGADFLMRAMAMEASLPSDAMRLLKFGRFESGTAPNIVSASTRIIGTLRAFDNGVFKSLQDGLCEAASAVKKRWGASVRLEYSESYPPLINDPALYRLAVQALEGMAYRELPQPTMLSEDFSYYLERLPGVFFKLGIETSTPLHTPEFDFDERALLWGVEALTHLARMA